MGKTAFIFPGQGAQYVGMGKDFVENFAESRMVFEEASDSLGYDMLRLVMEGTEEDLKKTEITQPSILTASIAALSAVTQEGIDCDFTAGLSLGEYSALVKAGSLKFKDAVAVVRQRGKFMQEAVPAGRGAMAAVIGMPIDKLKESLKHASVHGIVEIANFNSHEQLVISGETAGVEAAVKLALENGAMKAVMLPVSAPFHSSLLKPAAEKLHEVLKNNQINPLNKSVVSNADALVLKNHEEVVPALVKQVNNSVLWVPSIELMLDSGVDTFVEIGPGKALSGFVKRIAKSKGAKVNIYNVEDMVSFKNFVDAKNKGDN
jgi:[acyl-carrier-protein] S-malonyltransferase